MKDPEQSIAILECVDMITRLRENVRYLEFLSNKQEIFNKINELEKLIIIGGGHEKKGGTNNGEDVSELRKQDGKSITEQQP